MSITGGVEIFKIHNVPNTVYYIPNFITEAEEFEIINKVNGAPKPKWTQLSNRRLQNWGGVPHPNGMIAEAIPQWLKKYMDKVETLGLFSNETRLNHVLVNEYVQGQGIMPHLDGPLFYPTVTTISCGSHTVLNFYQGADSTSSNEGVNSLESCNGDNRSTKTDELYSLFIERRSLLILQDEMYKDYLHGISEINVDTISNNLNNLKQAGGNFQIGQECVRGTRISLTIRHVPKASKLKINFLK